jgi:DNA replication initiation complex subunit (GINS family)
MADLITYETIRNAHRNEKSEQMAKLPDGFWPAARAWLAGKLNSRDSTGMLEADSAKKLLEDIVNRRQRKTVTAALATVRGAAPPQGMTSEEAKLFDQLVATLKAAAQNALETALGADSIAEQKLAELKASIEDAKAQMKTDNKLAIEEHEDVHIPEQQPADATLKTLPSTRRVRVLTALPQVVSMEDRRTYGPFQAGQVAELPQDIVRVLAARSAIEMVT